MLADKFLQSSFFDSDNSKEGFNFLDYDIKSQKDFTTQSAPITSFRFKNSSENSYKQGFFTLRGRFMVYYGIQVGVHPKKFLDLSYSRLKPIYSNELNLPDGFMLARNGNVFEFKCVEGQACDEWIAALKSICVLNNFHEEYEPLKMIGKGSSARVYLVRAKSTGKQYAVKTFVKEALIETFITSNPKGPLLNEINIMRSLDHENIIKLHEVHETERSLYLVLELIEGKPLHHLLKKTSFRGEGSDKKIRVMIHSILDALAYIASKGIMHRDLKPANILVDKEGKLKIVDFGLATLINCSEYIFKKCGTPGYIAPEVFNYDPANPATSYDHRCDVFSAGCIFFYMLFGYPFFDGKGTSEVLQLNKSYNGFKSFRDIKKDPDSSPSSKSHKEDLSLLMELLEYDPKQRISAEQALKHAYFLPITTFEICSSKEIFLDPQSKYTHTHRLDLNSSRSIKNGDNQDYLIPMSPLSPLVSERTKKYMAKDSLYLNIGKPDLNGRMDTLTSQSANTSMVMKAESVNSTSNVPSNQCLSPVQKRTGGSPVMKKGNQSVLKTVIFRNMQKNCGMEDQIESIMRMEKSPSSVVSSKLEPLDPEWEDVPDLEENSEEIGDEGNENCQVQINSTKQDYIRPRKHPDMTREISGAVLNQIIAK